MFNYQSLRPLRRSFTATVFATKQNVVGKISSNGKKFLTYLPARLVQCPSRWYILFYQIDPSTGIRKKFQKTYDLDLRIRKGRANAIVKEINDKLLPTGWPYVETEVEEKNEQLDVLLLDAVKSTVRLINANTTRSNSHRTYNSRESIFSEWINAYNPKLTVGTFNSQMALKFMDYLVLDREVGNNTFNNYLRDMKKIMKEIGLRYGLEGNAFSSIKRKKKMERKIKHFSDEDRLVVANYIYHNDYWLYLAVLLIYYCHIRISELQRLRFSMFDLLGGVIIIPANLTKTYKTYKKDDTQKHSPSFY